MASRALRIGGLYALAVAQPLLAVLGDNAEFFASRRAGGVEVVVFAALVVLGPPLLAVGADALARGRLHLGLVALLVALIAVQLFKQAGDWGTVPMIAAAAVTGVGAAVAYARSPGLRSFATWLSPAPVVVLFLFLVLSPARDIAFGSDVAAAAIRTDSTTPVVMVVLDEVSMTTFLDANRRIDAKAYPNLARLASRANTYRTFTASGDETTRVVSSLLTGNPWRANKHPLPIASQYPRNLFTLLGRAFEMHVSEEASDLCPPRICAPNAAGSSERSGLGNLLHDAAVVYGHVVAPPGIERRLTPTDQTLGRFDDDDEDPGPHQGAAVLRELGEGGRPRRFEAWLRSIRPTARPALYFKHLLLPHLPWQYLPDGREYPPPSGDIRGADGAQSFHDPWFLRQSYQRHLLQARYTDRLIGRLLDRLEQQGLYDRALVVLTADNGEAFGKLGHSRHETDDATVAGIASTPLFVKLPGQRRGRYSDVHVRTIDVVPTILDALRIRSPWPMAGRSILRPDYRPAPDVTVDGHRNGHESKVTITLAEYRRRAAAELAAKERIFGKDVYADGPRSDLLGRRVGAGATRPAPGVRADLIAPGRLADVDTRAAVIPAGVTGRLDGSRAAPGLPLALALDGRIVATGTSARLTGDRQTYFSFMVPPTALHDGRNVPAVYLVTPGGLAALGP
jgi:hypothetical protein